MRVYFVCDMEVETNDQRLWIFEKLWQKKM